LIKGTADLPGKAVRVVSPDRPATDTTPLELQGQLMRYGDEQVARFITAFKEAAATITPEQRITLLELKVALTSDLWAIASGSNAYANLLDMLVVLSLSRRYAEELWPAQLGAAAQPLARAANAGEQELWKIAGRVLTSEQQDELRSAIQLWQKTHPLARDIMFARALDLSHQFAKQQRQKKSSQPSASVFQFLSLDPLAGLDPATRELTEARLFAERALYIGQRMPFMLRWQIELMSEELSRTPEFQQAMTNTHQVARSIQQIGRLAETLPNRLTQEREAILQALNEKTGELTELTARIQAALAQGNALATNTDLTLQSFERVLKHFPSLPTGQTLPPLTTVEDYTEAAEAFTTTARELTTLLDQLDHTLGSTNLARLEETINTAESRGREWVDYAFHRLIQGILVAAAALLLVLLVYRWLTHQLTSRASRLPPPTDGPETDTSLRP
jgi:hypothetical protein